MNYTENIARDYSDSYRNMLCKNQDKVDFIETDILYVCADRQIFERMVGRIIFVSWCHVTEEFKYKGDNLFLTVTVMLKELLLTCRNNFYVNEIGDHIL